MDVRSHYGDVFDAIVVVCSTVVVVVVVVVGLVVSGSLSMVDFVFMIEFVM